jgi:hypothetical protein
MGCASGCIGIADAGRNAGLTSFYRSSGNRTYGQAAAQTTAVKRRAKHPYSYQRPKSNHCTNSYRRKLGCFCRSQNLSGCAGLCTTAGRPRPGNYNASRAGAELLKMIDRWTMHEGVGCPAALMAAAAVSSFLLLPELVRDAQQLSG